MKNGKSGNTILESHFDHNHDKDEHYKMQVIRISVKIKVQDDVCERPLKLIYNELIIKTTNTYTLNKTDLN